MNTRNVLATTALGVVLFTGSASAAPGTVYEYLQGSVGGCDSIGTAFNDNGQGYSSVQVWQYEACNAVLNCYAEVPNGDVVQVHTQAKQGTGALPPDVLMTCYTGVVPTSVSLDCGANGSFEQHTTGRNTIVNNGVKTAFAGDSDQATADCTLEIDGVTYESTSGTIYRAKSKP